MEKSSLIKIRPLSHNPDAAPWCAQLMSNSEPWLTLGRNYEEALSIITDSLKEVYLAEKENEIMGFVVIQMVGAFTGYIQSIAVQPSWRGHGIGQQLIAFAEKRIFAEQPNVFICVSSFNPRARQLYERLGYKVIGELNDYIVPGHAEILLRKSLGPLVDYDKTKAIPFATGDSPRF